MHHRNPNEKCELGESKQTSKNLNGGMMHFEAGSPYLWEAMMECNRTYRPGLRWVDMRSPLLYRSAVSLLKLPKDNPAYNIKSLSISSDPSNSVNMTLHIARSYDKLQQIVGLQSHNWGGGGALFKCTKSTTIAHKLCNLT